MRPPGTLSWIGIARLGLVQTSLGAIVVLTTSTLNRIMVVELALPAMVPGLLVALHYLLQILRPRLGHGSDVGGRRTPWIVGGMATLATGGILAAVATAWMHGQPIAGFALAFVAFTLIGVGVGACGTSLLVLLAKRVEDRRRGAAATIVWMMMIAGFAVTAVSAGQLLDPYSPERLIVVVSGVCVLAFVVTVVAVYGVEGRQEAQPAALSSRAGHGGSFRMALAQVWDDPQARRFTVFIFVSMLAYSAQDLILEPFAGSVFGFTPGQTTKLSGVLHGGVLVGMFVVALASSAVRGRRFGSLRTWMVGGCIGSAVALLGLSAGGVFGQPWPLRETVFALGVANGAFAVAAIGSMMGLASAGGSGREGVRMGLWGASQAISFGIGGFAGTVASDIARSLISAPGVAYATVFGLEAALFLASAALAATIGVPQRGNARPVDQDSGRLAQAGEGAVAG